MNARSTVFHNRPARAIAALGLILAIAMVSLAPGDEKPSPAPEPAPTPSPAPASQGATDKAATVEDSAAAPVSGREIFLREWLPKDSRSHGGDGLGPVFNDSSCVACHNQGGAGGGGPVDKNVDIISAFVVAPHLTLEPTPPGQPATSPAEDEQQIAAQKERLTKQLKEELTKLHPGFATARSVVLHHSGCDAKYDAWRARFLQNQVRGVFAFLPPMRVSKNSGLVVPPAAVPAPSAAPVAAAEDVPAFAKNVQAAALPQVSVVSPVLDMGTRRAEEVFMKVRAVARANSNVTTSMGSNGLVQTVLSHRNPTALFGAGLIDSIPDAAIEAQAKVTHSDKHITGRVSRMKDGKIARFGWKAQKVNLYDFTVTACGVELGLQVPDHPQSGLPLDPNYQPAGYDLNQREVDALVDYLRALPAPASGDIADSTQREFIESGRHLFTSVGCAGCHVAKLGGVQGIYSDLLLHDMGEENGDTGGYGVFVPQSPGTETGEAFPALTDAFKPQQQQHQQQRIVGFGQEPLVQPDEKTIGATRLEWRTPALWGVRDSAPYMHDGRASALEHAIALHGGEAHEVARYYFGLTSNERQQLTAFMKTLVAPSEVARAE